MIVSKLNLSLPPELHAFVEQVVSDPQLQKRLAPIFEADAFLAEALKVAEENGVELNPDILAAVLRPDPLGLSRFAAAPISCDGWPPSGWLPTRSVATDGAPAFDWLWFGDSPLTRSFFEDDVRMASALPFNWLFRIRTSMEAVVAGAAEAEELPLQGLIYHMSRCGSTLLAQMLGAAPGNAVSSEPEPLDATLRWARLQNMDLETAICAARSIVSALGRNRGTGANCHIIKLDPWHSGSLPLMRAAFPSANWVYLYRNAVEVMVSTMQMPALHTVPGLLPEMITGVADNGNIMHEDYAAQALAFIGQQVLDHFHLGGGMVLAYPDIADKVINSIAPHFSLSLSDDDAALIMAASRRDSKNAGQAFSSDVARKHAEATESILSAANRWITPVETLLAQIS